ncbi:MAG: tyrosine-type recombinase/integrase [Ginsengibacter sp.]
MKPFYYSQYGPLFEDYLTLKKSLGYKCSNVWYSFRKFDRYIIKTKYTSIGLTKELCEEWRLQNPNEAGKSWYNRIQVIRSFSAYLQQLNYESFLPILPKIKSTYTPYIYTKKEITLLFNQCDNLCTQTTCYNSIVLIIPCLFRLLYGTGVRLGEALSLLCSDINVSEKYILLRNSKNGKDRIVPLSDSLTQACEDYLECRNRLPLRKKTDLFFVHPNGENCTNRQVYGWFRKILYKAGIPHQGKHQGPHIHHLRHTFSVHSLAAMAEVDLDLNYSLPILSVYLGHQSVASTDRYVRLTAEIYPSIMAKVNKALPLLYPDIFKQTSYETK